VLLGVTGSVAAIKTEALEQALNAVGCEVKVMLSNRALHFSPAREHWLTDEKEWQWTRRGDVVLHVELRRWADVLLIAPLSANSLAKLVHGLADNLVTSVARGWEFQKPMIVCPAMNTTMWNHPVTREHLHKLESWGSLVLPPISKTLVCGDSGAGAMAEVDTIVEFVRDLQSKMEAKSFSVEL